MPKLADHQSSTVTKLLLLGESKSGKSGSLASLVQAGYRLKIVDYDNGLDILANKLREIDPKLLDKVEFETCTDRFKISGGKSIPQNADAWDRGLRALERFIAEGVDSTTILVLDSLSFASKAAMRTVLKVNNRLALAPHQSDWGVAQGLTENLLAMLFDSSLATNIICTAHIKYIGNEDTGQPVRGYADAIGQALSPSIAKYFNSTLLLKSFGPNRKLLTQSFGNIELGSSNPGKVKKEYDISNGLAEYFAAVRSPEAKSTKAA